MFGSKTAVWFGLFLLGVSTAETAFAQEEVIEQWVAGVVGVSSGWTLEVKGDHYLSCMKPNVRASFVEVGRQAGLGEELISNIALWFDYNRDGFLDLYVSNWTFLEGFEDYQNTL